MAEGTALEVQREIEEEVLAALREITRANSVYSNFIRQQYGLTVPQLILLRMVATMERASGGRLAKSVSLSHATVTGILARLEKRGLLRREKSDTDKRQRLVVVTGEGKELLDRAPTPLQSRFLHRFRELKEWEQHMILSSLQRVAELTRSEELEGMAAATEDPHAVPGEEPTDSVVGAV